MKAVLVNYNFTPEWLLESDLDYFIYDRSDDRTYLKDFPQERIRYTENVGDVDYDKLGFLVDNYDSLPDVFLWGKTNLFKYISKSEFETVRHNRVFTPLLTQYHKTYKDRLGIVCYYQDGMYYERNDSWYLNVLDRKFARSWHDWARQFQLPEPAYIPFAPGGNYILTSETVRKYSRDLYEKMRSTLPYTVHPAEAHCCERSYYLLWQ